MSRMTTSQPRSLFDSKKAELNRLFDREPPHAVEAEAALLGALILDEQLIGEVVQIIRGSGDFYRAGHAAIYEVLVELFDRNEPVTMVALNQRLRDRGQIEEVGGLDYLVRLAENVPVTSLAPNFARMVREKAIVRQLIETTATILDRAYGSGEPVGQLLDEAERSIFQLAETGSSSEATDLRTLLEETYERLEQQDGRLITGLDTGFFELNEMTSGLQNGEMIIIAARPSMGKTALALNIAEQFVAVDKIPAAFFSLEMSKQQLAQRLLCSRSGVDSQRLRRNMVRDDDWQMLQQAMAELHDAPLFIDDTPGLSILALRAKARRLAAQHHIKAVFIDYLQLMSATGIDGGREQEVSAISRGVKALARELNVPVVCLSQLNRGPESREGHRPRMSDLRESGSIEQDADVVLMLHREDYYHRADPDYTETGISELIIAKQRNGPTGTVKLQFNSGTTRFNNLATGSMHE